MKKRAFVYTLILLFLISCQAEKKNGKTIVTEKGTSEIISVVKNDSLTEIELHEENTRSGFNIDSFLQNPFDLHQFKNTNLASLSGSISLKDFHYKPDEEGVVYRFFMFDPKKLNQLIDGHIKRNALLGYIGSNKKNCLVYSYKNIALILKIKNNKVDWLKYIKLSFDLNEEIEIEGLYDI